MANTAVVYSSADKVLAGRPFTARVAVSLDEGARVVRIVPNATVAGGGLAAQVSTPTGLDKHWMVTILGVPTGQPEVSLGATVYLDVSGAGSSVEATVAKVQCVDPNKAEGFAWFNTFEQSGLVPVVVL